MAEIIPLRPDAAPEQNMIIPATLKQGGGDGTFGDMDIVDAKIAAAEARTDTKFAEVMGELKAMRAEMSHMPSTWAMVGTMAGSAVAVISAILAVLAFGGQMFSVGMDAQGIAAKATNDATGMIMPQVRAVAEQSNANSEILKSLLRQGEDSRKQPVPKE